MIELLRAVDAWQLAAGLGLFLFGMAQAESALTTLAGPRLKRALRAYTDRPTKAIATGIGATAMVQSSSAVGLMTLAFVGAGVIALSNGLGVIIGANLGTTMTGWIVTTLGFKVDIGRTALAMIAVGSLVMMATVEASRLHRLARFAIGFGLLFFGLEMMKSAVAASTGSVEAAITQGQHPLVYLAIGVAITALIQSSSAMMMITLSLLDAGFLSLLDAAALVVGADLGTTLTVMLGGLRGSVEKRRVAVAHVIFNLVTDAIAFVVMLPALPWLLAAVGISDPLYGVVAFHSLFNVLGILLFFPFLDRFASFLRRILPRRETRAAVHLEPATLTVPEAALDAIEREVDALQQTVVSFVRHTLQTDDEVAARRSYASIKRVEGEIFHFTVNLDQQSLDEVDVRRLHKLRESTRNLVHAAKCLKDVVHNVVELRDFDREDIGAMLDEITRRQMALLEQLSAATSLNQLRAAASSNSRQHAAVHQTIVTRGGADWPFSTLFNVNRELALANFDLINALADRHLELAEAEQISSLPIF